MSRRRARIPEQPTWYDRQTCPGKVPFQTEAVAKQRVRELRDADPGCGMHAYRCSNCGSWHLGHEMGRATGIRYMDRWFQLPARGQSQ